MVKKLAAACGGCLGVLLIAGGALAANVDAAHAKSMLDAAYKTVEPVQRDAAVARAGALKKRRVAGAVPFTKRPPQMAVEIGEAEAEMGRCNALATTLMPSDENVKLVQKNGEKWVDEQRRSASEACERASSLFRKL